MHNKGLVLILVTIVLTAGIVIGDSSGRSIKLQSSGIGIEATDTGGRYAIGEALTGYTITSFTTEIPVGSFLKAYIDGSVISQVELTDARIPDSSGYMWYDFDYNFTARVDLDWTEYPEQIFDYHLNVEGTCGGGICFDEDEEEIPCDEPPYNECGACPTGCYTFIPDCSNCNGGWQDDFTNGQDTINKTSVKEVSDANGLYASLLSNYYINTVDTIWTVKCRDEVYRENCDQVPGADGENVELSMRLECLDPSSGTMWIEMSIPDITDKLCTPDIHPECDGIGDRYFSPESSYPQYPRVFDADSLSSIRKYGGPKEHDTGGVFKLNTVTGEKVYQGDGTGALWNEETNIIVVQDYNAQATYTVSYLPANGPKLCAYTDTSVAASDTHYITKQADIGGGSDTLSQPIECNFDNDYVAAYTQNDFDMAALSGNLFTELFPDCPDSAAEDSCTREITYTVDKTSGPTHVTVSADSDTLPITVTASTTSQEIANEKSFRVFFNEFSNLVAPGQGSHTLFFRIMDGLTTLETSNTVDFVVCTDADHDGYCSVEEEGEDCDDTRATVYPGAPELCDYKDNDCDGEVDDDFNVGENCYEAGNENSSGYFLGNSSSICTGFFVCSADGFGVTCDNSAMPGDSFEVCNNTIDDDCDNLIDELDLFEGGVLQDCVWQCETGDVRPCGISTGICSTGNELCSNGQWSGECLGEEGPETEVCNGFDDNCDGKVDNIGGGTSAQGTGCWCYSPTRFSNSPREETVDECNGIDDDCDGEVDEDLICCTSGEVRQCGTSIGECQYGTQTCSSGGNWNVPCVGSIEPIEEVCYDNLDNDCDGELDEEAFCNLDFTCFNEALDLNEEGVDCGGSCEKNCENFSSWIILAIVMIAIIIGLVYMQLRP
jgi:hypothetical protein